jgi:hypothetical protein
MNKKGTIPMKRSGANPFSGHARLRSNPPSIEIMSKYFLFIAIIFSQRFLASLGMTLKDWKRQKAARKTPSPRKQGVVSCRAAFSIQTRSPVIPSEARNLILIDYPA